MKKRNTKINEFVTGTNAKILCAKFSPKTQSHIASGDNQNTLCLWRLNKDRPLMTLSSQTSSPNVTSEITALSFSLNENEIVSGTNRGSVSVWDITAQKLITTLKGHSVAINTIAHFPAPTQDNLLLTGSDDALIKLWDIRQKQTVTQFKGHDGRVNCLEIAPDGKWFTSGAQDSLVKLWDIGTGKSIYTFNLHEAPINCLKFNPYDLTLATGSADKCVKYWDLEKFGLICSTKHEATGIQCLNFDLDGKYLFTAAQDILRVWYVDTNDLILLDNVETTWRGVQDLAIQPGSTSDEDSLLGLAITSVSFGLWSCPLKVVNRDPKVSAEKFMEIRKKQKAKLKAMEPQPKKTEQNQMEIEKTPPLRKEPSYNKEDKYSNQMNGNNFQNQQQQQNNYVQQVQNYPPVMNQNPNFQPMQPGLHQYQQGVYNNYPNQPYQPNMYPNQPQYSNYPVDPRVMNYPQGIPGYNNISPVHQDQNVNNLNFDNRDNRKSNENFVLEKKPSSDKNGQIQIHDAGLMDKLNQNPIRDDSANLKETTIIEINKEQLDHLNVSSFIKNLEGDTGDKKANYDMISEISKDHSKFKIFMKQRLDCLELISHHWNSGNVRSSLNAIQKLDLKDPTLVMDLLNMSNAMNKTGQMNVEAACIFLQKAVFLVESKFDHHVKMGFKFINKTFKQFYDEIIKIKTANVMNMVDLAREERVRKYDKLIQEFENIAQKERIKKLAVKNKDDVGEMASRLLAELDMFLSRVKTDDSNRR